VVAGLLFETDHGATVRYPFAAATLEAGSSINDAIEWREVPVGLLPVWHGPPSGIAAHDIGAGEPLLPGRRADVVTPAGWWSIPVPLPVATTPGTRLRLLDSLTGDQFDGIVVSAGIEDGFVATAMVAFSPDDAPPAAQAIAGDAFVVMLGPGTSAAAGNG
jgi:hypothetical protein